MNNEIEYYLESIDLLNEGVARDLETWWFGPMMTGEYDKLHTKLLKLVDKAKTPQRIQYLINDCNNAIPFMNNQIKRIQKVQKELNEGKKPSDKQAYKMIKHGNTPKKIQDHINWCKSVYRPALNKKKKEIMDRYK